MEVQSPKTFRNVVMVFIEQDFDNLVWMFFALCVLGLEAIAIWKSADELIIAGLGSLFAYCLLRTRGEKVNGNNG